MIQDKKIFVKSALYMDTVVSLKVVTSESSESEVEGKMSRAFEAFHFVERVCSRFNEHSELRSLSNHIGSPIQASNILFEAIHFSIVMANLTNGDFDPTLGYKHESLGFNRHYLTGEKLVSNPGHVAPVSYLDIHLDHENRSDLLRKPLMLDLGAVA